MYSLLRTPCANLSLTIIPLRPTDVSLAVQNEISRRWRRMRGLCPGRVQVGTYLTSEAFVLRQPLPEKKLASPSADTV
jgi:hypothetical protein